MEYYRPNVDAMDAQKKQAAKLASSGKNKFAKGFEEGVTFFRLLPPWSSRGVIGHIDANWYKRSLAWETIKDGALPVISSNWEDLADKDPIMNVLNIAAHTNSDAADLRKISPRFLINVLVRSFRRHDQRELLEYPDWLTPQVRWVTNGAYRALEGMVGQPGEPDVCDPINGCWLKMTLTKGDRTEYKVEKAPHLGAPITEDEAVMQNILDNMMDLDKYMPRPNEEMWAKQQAVAQELRIRFNLAKDYAGPVSMPNVPQPPITPPANTVNPMTIQGTTTGGQQSQGTQTANSGTQNTGAPSVPPTATSTESAPAPSNPALSCPSCFQNIAKGLPPAEGQSCETCMYRVPCSYASK